MKRNTRYPLPMALLWLVLGSVLILCGIFEVVDSYWSGMGGGLLGAGIVQLIRSLRYKSDPEYQAKADRANKDERNKFLAAQAWSWAGYLFVMICAIASIVLRILGQDMYSVIAGYCVCLIILLYWASYMILRRKY